MNEMLVASMAKFSIYAKEVLIGHTMLERGDPSMGVAFGDFIPTAEYAQLQQVQRELTANRADQSALGLCVYTESGIAIPCVGVGILDYSPEIDPPYVEVLGIPYPLYGDLFPDHVARDNQRFNEAL
jgi:hypothetical protein